MTVIHIKVGPCANDDTTTSLSQSCPLTANKEEWRASWNRVRNSSAFWQVVVESKMALQLTALLEPFSFKNKFKKEEINDTAGCIVVKKSIHKQLYCRRLADKQMHCRSHCFWIHLLTYYQTALQLICMQEIFVYATHNTVNFIARNICSSPRIMISLTVNNENLLALMFLKYI